MIGNKGFARIEEKFNWNKAKKACEDKGYRMASLATDDEIAYAKEVTATYGGHWIGVVNPSLKDCIDSGCNNVFEWLHDGSPFTIADEFVGVLANKGYIIYILLDLKLISN